jgi:hypothetical protein
MFAAHRAQARSLFRPAVWLGVLALAAAGCQGKGDVSGKVSYKGKPLVWGTVTFEGKDGGLHYCNIASDGSYSVSGVAIGEAKVAVSSINPKSSDFVAIQREGSKKPPPPPRPAVTGWFPIPAKYDTPFKSGLVYAIKGGENQIDIVLE